MKLNIRTPLFIIAIPILISTGCTYDKEELLYPPKQTACDTLGVTFTKVKSIITSKCSSANCHSTATAKGGVALETYDQIKAKSDRIKQRALVDKTMPPRGPLSTTDVAILECWLGSGMPNN